MYTAKDALIEEQDAIARAVAGDDTETLLRIAQAIKESGDDEYAESVRKLAFQAERNIWAHDEMRDNQ